METEKYMLDTEKWNKLSMEEQIFQTIKRSQTVTFAELQDSVTGFKGNSDWFYSGKANLVLWQGISKEAVDTMLNMLVEKKIFAYPSIEFGHLVYLYDHHLPTLPKVTVAGIKRGGYKKPHWLPVVFNTYPSEENLYFDMG